MSKRLLTPSSASTQRCYLSGVHLGWSSPVSTSHLHPTQTSPGAETSPAAQHTQQYYTMVQVSWPTTTVWVLSCDNVCRTCLDITDYVSFKTISHLFKQLLLF